MINLPDIQKADVKGKKVFLRADLDVPLVNDTIEDDTRLRDGLPTIQYLLDHGARIFLAGHLGRPVGKDPRFSLRPVGDWFAQNLASTSLHPTAADGFERWEITPQLVLLENIRFYPEEEENKPEFAEKLSSLADIYVNDAFSVCHRDHASIVGIARLLPHFAGFRLQKEVETMSQVLENPARPLIVVIGGKKIETKLPLVAKMISVADKVLVGGLIAQELKEKSPKLIIAESNSDGTDVSEKSLKEFVEVIKTAKTIVWNGPIGKIGSSEHGTSVLAKEITLSQAYKVVGGGDTIGFLKRSGLLEKFDFVSTGGGAMLAFLSGGELPGLAVLTS